MENYKIVILASFCFLFLRCESEHKATSELTVNSTGTILKIPIDSLTPSKTIAMLPFTTGDGVELISYLNRNLNEIQFYDIEEKKLIKRIKIETEGPNSVGKVKGFRAVSLDSVFILPSAQTTLFIVDGGGKVLEKFDFSRVGNYSSSYSYSWSAVYNLVEFDGEKINLSQDLQGHILKLSKSDLNATPLWITYDMKRQQVEKSKVTYPSHLLEEGPKEFRMSRVKVDEKYVCSFTTDHNLFIVNSDGNQVREVSGKSQYFNEIPALPADLNMNSYLNNYYRSPRYGSLVYDSYREIYYRFAYPGAEIDPDNMERYKEPVQFSIIIFDKDLRKLGETMLPKNTYLMNNFFIGKEGLYLSKNHPYNEADFDEDFLTFEIFNVEEI